MSHFTTIRTEIKDIESLRAACAEMGLELVANAEARGYSNNRTRAEHVVRLNGPYDIALNKNKEGSYALTADWWGGHVEREVGKNAGRLLQLYGVHKATREARRRGYSVQRQVLKDGSIKLMIGGV